VQTLQNGGTVGLAKVKRAAFSILEEALYSLRDTPGFDDGKELILAFLDALNAPALILLAHPPFVLHLPTLTFRLGLTPSFFDKYRDTIRLVFKGSDNARN